MKTHFLAAIATAALAMSALPSFAANTKTDASAGMQGGAWTAANVDAKTPFGSIQTNAAGSTPTEVGTFASGLSGQQVIELVGRCNVILAASGMSGMGAGLGMENTGTVGSGSTTSSDATAGSDTAAADASTKASGSASSDQTTKTGSGSVSGAYDQQSVQLCQNLNSAIFGSAGSINQ